MPTYHKKQKNQSKQVFRLVGGRHTRPAPTGRPGDRITIERGDTLHITKAEADKFGDKFELVLPKKAADVEIDISDDAADETIEDTVESADETTDDDEDEVDVSKATGQGEPDRQDFSSLKAYEMWEKGGKPDLSKVAKSGHGGRTYALKDVKGVL